MSNRTVPGGEAHGEPGAGHEAEQKVEQKAEQNAEQIAAPYAEQYAEGRRAGLAGSDRHANPYFARADDAEGHPESHEVWRTKYDVWRQGWMEGHSTVERGAPPKR